MIDPVAFYIFGLPIRWYALAYVFGILGGIYIAKRFAKRVGNFEGNLFDVFVNYAVIGIIIGGRLGHVIFYEPEYFYCHPVEIFKVWHGGMSFHGGFLGLLFSAYLFCRKYRIEFLRFCDVLAIASPLGLFLGRVANFLNGELIGKESNTFFAVAYFDNVLRHPTQLYEAFLEGFVLMLVMIKLGFSEWSEGKLSGVFCVWYALSRIFCEFFKEADTSLNYLVIEKIGFSLGQLLSVPLLLVGLYLIFRGEIRENRGKL